MNKRVLDGGEKETDGAHHQRELRPAGQEENDRLHVPDCYEPEVVPAHQNGNGHQAQQRQQEGKRHHVRRGGQEVTDEYGQRQADAIDHEGSDEQGGI
jgi:hypothetical protein